jgi:spore coat protein U-like protein
VKCNLKACIGAALLAAAAPAFAATCTITTVPTLGFGSYDVFAAAPTVTSQIAKFRCNGNQATITVGVGKSATSGTISGRQMAQQGVGATGRLNYNIYKDGGYSNLWGDGTAGTTALVVNTINKAASVPVYGKIDPGQDAPVGNYKDTVIMSVNP